MEKDIYDIVTGGEGFMFDPDEQIFNDGEEAIHRHRELAEASHSRPRDPEDYLQLSRYGRQAEREG